MPSSVCKGAHQELAAEPNGHFQAAWAGLLIPQLVGGVGVGQEPAGTSPVSSGFDCYSPDPGSWVWLSFIASGAGGWPQRHTASWQTSGRL